jgi:hypothetical protein
MIKLNSIESFLEGTVASDIAQSTGSMGLQKKKRKGQGSGDCPCKTDPESEECKEKQALKESPVGSVGRTGAKDAIEYITPELRAEFKRIVKKLGGKTVAKELLNTMNANI